MLWGMLLGLAALAGWPAGAAAAAKTIHVPADYPLIQSAIQASQSGDEIVVAQGVYRENLNFLGKNITLRSNFDPATVNLGSWWYVYQTVLAGGYKGSVVMFSGSESSKCVLRGFTIRDGSGAIRGGGCKATIEYNIFQYNNNVFGVFGTMNQGGALSDCNGLIQKNIFRYNHSNYGGALASCNGTIQNNLICQNATHAGSSKPAPAAAKDTPLGYVLPGSGGALYNCTGLIRGNTIVDNYVQDASGWGAGGLYGCKGTLVNNIIYHTTMTAALEFGNCSKPTYCLFRAARSGTGNLAADPRFANIAGFDFHLQTNSPAIDAGQGYADLKDDYDGHQRRLKVLGKSLGDGTFTDIGAFEALPMPVAVWVPYGGPPGGIKEGLPLTVDWILTAPAGTAIRLWLLKGQMFVCDLGQFSATGGVVTSTVNVPGALATGSDYTILGISVYNHDLGLSSPAFTITGSRRNAVGGGAWTRYD